VDDLTKGLPGGGPSQREKQGHNRERQERDPSHPCTKEEEIAVMPIARGTRIRSQSSEGFWERVRRGVVVGTGARVDGRGVPNS
jgi:hypothetical protein